ncbi:MAG: hypothetical protein ACR2HN_01690 [Tepidiformaceae bacterium]
MQIEVIEFELDCDIHGTHKTLVPVEFPRPKHCAHCFLPLAGRRELRRLSIEGPLASPIGSEAWIG